jgi:hypothetical protein
VSERLELAKDKERGRRKSQTAFVLALMIFTRDAKSLEFISI